MDIPAPLDPIEAITQSFADAVVSTKEFRGETTIVVDPEYIVSVLQYLKQSSGLVYNFLSDISAVDYYGDPPTDERPERFGVAYHIYSMLYNRRLRVKVFLPEEAPVVRTITDVWPAANWLEREIFDLMGIEFAGHPDLRRLMMPDDWNGHPHRRDYPMGKETVQFSFNVEEIMEHKPFAQN